MGKTVTRIENALYPQINSTVGFDSICSTMHESSQVPNLFVMFNSRKRTLQGVIKANTYFLGLVTPWMCCIRRKEVRMRIRKSLLRQFSKYMNVDSLYQKASNEYYFTRLFCKRSTRIRNAMIIRSKQSISFQPCLQQYENSGGQNKNITLPGMIDSVNPINISL